MGNTTKPAALQLADMLDALGWRSVDKDMKTAAAELRRLHACVAELEAAAAAAEPAPQGWKRVPVVPTDAMAAAAINAAMAYPARQRPVNGTDVWAAMVTAAPQPPVPQEWLVPCDHSIQVGTTGAFECSKCGLQFHASQPGDRFYRAAPQVAPWDGTINPADFTVSTFAPGVSSAWLPKPQNGVCITHVPSGCFESETSLKSAHGNKALAWERLIKRLEALAAAAKDAL